MKYIIKFLFSFIICIYSCTSPENKSFPSDQIVIDLDVAEEKDILASLIFKNIKAIILEENTDCLIGRVSSFQVYDGLLYILDADVAKGLFVFDHDGQYIRKIGCIGRGPGEYSSISDFTIDTDNKTIMLLDNKRVHKYKIEDGSFIESMNITASGITIRFIQYYDHALYTDASPSLYTDDCLLMKVDMNSGNVLEKYLKPSEYNKGWNDLYSRGKSFFLNRINGVPKYAQLYMDDIISLDGIAPFITIKSENLVTKEDINDIKKKVDLPQQTMALSGISKVHYMHNYVESDHFIFFNYDIGHSRHSVLHDIASGTTRLFRKIKDDFLYEKYDPAPSMNFYFSNDKGAYSLIPTNSLSYLIESVDKYGLKSDINKRKELMNLHEDANPVIFYYEYKD